MKRNAVVAWLFAADVGPVFSAWLRDPAARTGAGGVVNIDQAFRFQPDQVIQHFPGRAALVITKGRSEAAVEVPALLFGVGISIDCQSHGVLDCQDRSRDYA